MLREALGPCGREDYVDYFIGVKREEWRRAHNEITDVGARALPAALLGSAVAAGAADRDSRTELERLRLENEALAAVVDLVASSPDLDHVLGRVVDLLTRVSGSHATFVYLVAGDRLRLRAASPVYARQVGRIEFGVDEGLAGWAVGHREAAFIRERAMDDPRTNYIPELEEDRFQSMAAVPVPSRSGDVLGVIVLHTAEPHEFDEGILNVLSQTASVIAGAIENAKLYEESQQRVTDLTRLSSLSQRIAAVTQRADLYRVATTGVRELLPCDHCRLLELDPSGRLVVVASDPPDDGDPAGGETAEVLLEMLQSSPSETLRLRGVAGRALAVPVAAGSELLGALMVSAEQPWHDHGDELLRAIAHQIAVALEKTELIESLSEEGIARELFAALQEDRIDVAQARARKLGADLDRPHVVLEARPLRLPAFADGADARLERSLRQAVPGTICDADGRRVRAFVPGGDTGALVTLLGPIAREYGVAIGVSTERRGPPTRAARWARPPTPRSSAYGCSRTAASCPTPTWARTATSSARCATAGRGTRCARRSTGWPPTTASAAPSCC